MAELKKVGAQLVVEGKDEAIQNLQAFEQNTEAVTRGIQVAATVIEKFGADGAATLQAQIGSWQNFGDLVAKAAAGDATALEQLRQVESKLNDEIYHLVDAQTQAARATSAETAATEQLTAAQLKAQAARDRWLDGLYQAQQAQTALARAEEEEAGALNQRAQQIVQAGIAFGASGKEMSQALQEIGLSSKEARDVLEQYGISLEKTEQQGFKVGLAFFALSIAARGVRDIGRELGKIYGEEVTQSFQKLADTMQTIGSFGSAGALIGSLFGPEGTLIGAGVGATIGVVSTLPQLLDQTTVSTQALVDSFDKLAKKQDAADQLQKIGDISKETATNLVKAASATDDYAQRFARDLENIAKAQQEQENAKPPLIQAAAASAFFGPELTNQVIAQREKQAATDKAAAEAAIQLDAAILQVNEHYAASISTLQKWTQSGDDLTAVLKETTGATQENVDSIQAVLKVHPEWGKAMLDNIQNIRNLNVGLKDAPQYADDYTKALQAQTEALKINTQVLEAQGKIQAEFEPLIKQLANDSLPKATDTLMQYGNVSQDAADRFLKFAQTHRDAAADVKNLAQEIATDKEQLADLELHGEGASQAAQNLRDHIAQLETTMQTAILTHQDYTDVLTKLAAAEDKAAQAAADAAAKLGQLDTKTAQARAAAQQSYQDAIDNAARTRRQADDDAEQSSRDRSADAWQKWSDKVRDINSQLADKVADINQQLGDRLSDIQTQLSNRIADIGQQLQDKLFQIDQELANKKAELAHSYADKLNSENQKIAQAAQDLANKLVDIERTRVEQTEALAFNTHEQLETAQTDHDRNRILERARFEQSQIDQRANDARTTAEKEYQTKLQQIEQEKQAALEQYQYELALAERLAAQKRAEAQRTAAEQIAQAERNAAQQIAIAQREAAERLAVAQREAAQQMALAERQRNEEMAAIQRQLAEQIAAAARAEQNKAADAARSLAERNKAIQQSYDLERQNIEDTRNKALKALNEILQLYAELMGISIQFAQELARISEMEHQMAAARGYSPVGGGNFGASGLDMTVPPGFPNDTFPVYATSGERVTITPPSVTNNSSAKNITFIVNDATDPHRVAHIIDDHLASIAWS